VRLDMNGDAWKLHENCPHASINIWHGDARDANAGKLVIVWKKISTFGQKSAIHISVNCNHLDKFQ